MIDSGAFLLPLTRRQRAIVLVLAAIVAATRFLAFARTVWEWDETLFLLGMRDYDVALHQPHPPGFPVFIAMARLFALVTPNDFRALQCVAMLAGMLVFPAIFLLARELRFSFATSIGAAMLFAFFPNVWFFGGAAFSDVPSIVLVVFACAFLLRGAKAPHPAFSHPLPPGEGSEHPAPAKHPAPELSLLPAGESAFSSPGGRRWREAPDEGLSPRRAYFLGTLLLALAIGIRPQNLLVGLFPGALATWRRGWRDAILALLLGAVVCAVAFGGAIYATGSYERYMTAVRHHGDYIARVDSWRSPERPALWRISARFFFQQYQAPALSILMSLFVLGSIGGAIRRRDSRVLYAILTFAPMALMAWLMLDRFSISRFSIGYAPLFALLAADGIARASRGSTRLELAIVSVIALAFFVWTLPALTSARNELSPTVRAVDAVKRTLDPKRDRLYAGHTMTRFLDYLAPGFPYTRVLDDRAVPLSSAPNAWLLAEITDTKPQGRYFRRERGHLWNIARHHYFNIVLAPVRDRGEFGEGWYARESEGIDEWRWMSGRGIVRLPPLRDPALLRMHFALPVEVFAQQPEVTVMLNGRTVERWRPDSGLVTRDWHVVANPTSPNILEMRISRTHRPTDDARDLGLKLQFLAWGPH